MQDSKRGSWYTLTWGVANTAFAYLVVGKTQENSNEVDTKAKTSCDSLQDLGYVMVSNPREQNFAQDLRPPMPYTVPDKIKLMHLEAKRPNLLVLATANKSAPLIRNQANHNQPWISKHVPKPKHVKANRRRILSNG